MRAEDWRGRGCARNPNPVAQKSAHSGSETSLLLVQVTESILCRMQRPWESECLTEEWGGGRVTWIAWNQLRACNACSKPLSGFSAAAVGGFLITKTTLDFSSHPPGAGADVTMNKLRVVDSECGAHRANPALLMNHAHR